MIPKNPARRDKRLTELAKGEHCTLAFPGAWCDPATTVWAHSNALNSNKGMGYKGDDYAGVFACARCHKIIDQPGPSDPSAATRAFQWTVAVTRTHLRLFEISESPTLKPWRIETARRALVALHLIPDAVTDVRPKIRVQRRNVEKP